AHAQETATAHVVAAEQFFATHVLVAGGDVALADAEFLGPTRDGVLVEAHQCVLVTEQMPRAGAAAKGIDFMPGQVPTPAADGVPRRTTAAATQSGEAGVFHVVQMEDTFHAGDQGEDAG